MFRFITDFVEKTKKVLGVKTSKPAENKPSRRTSGTTSKNEVKKTPPANYTLPSHLKGKKIGFVAKWAGEQARMHQNNEDKLLRVASDLIGWMQSKKTAVNTKRGYITKINNMIKRADVKHHDFNSKLTDLMTEYPQHKKLLGSLRSSNAVEIGGTIAGIKETLEGDKSGLYDAISDLPVYCLIASQLDIHAMTRQQKDNASKEADKKANHRHTHQETIRVADIEAIIKEGLQSDSYGRLSFALSLATGRRSIEVMYTGEFKELHGSLKSIEFYGQAKKRKGTEVDNYPIYVIGCSASEVVEGIKKLRNIPALKKHLKNAEKEHKHDRREYIKQKTQNTRLEASNVAMGYGNNRKYSKVVYKDSRAIYTRICLDKYFNKGADSYYKEKTEVVFLQDLLGHSNKRDQQNYLQFIIDYDLPRTPKSERLPPQKTKVDNADIGTGKNKDAELFEVLCEKIKNMDELHSRTRNALLDLNENVIAYALANPTKRIHKTAIVKKIGCSKNVADIYAGNKKRDGAITVGLAESVLTEYNKKI